MKTLRRLCAAFVLTLALALSTFAGDMTTGITAPPPDPQATATGDMSTPGVTGNMPTGVTGEISAPGVTATDPATEVVLSLLQGLLSLF